MSFMNELMQPEFQQWGIAFLKGAMVTLEISAGAFVVGLVLGVLGAGAKLSGRPFLKSAADCYTTLCRAVPELLLILLLYYAGTDAFNVLLVSLGREAIDINGFAAAIIVLGIVQGAYAAEIIRGAVLAIPHGQIEAAAAYGIKPWARNRFIVLPAMAPYAVSGLANLWMVLIKDSALISVVGFNELMYTAKQAAGTTKHYMFFYLLAAAIYLVITLLSNEVVKRIERKFHRWMPAFHG